MFRINRGRHRELVILELYRDPNFEHLGRREAKALKILSRNRVLVIFLQLSNFVQVCNCVFNL